MATSVGARERFRSTPWCPRLLASPIFASIRATAARLPTARFPTHDELNTLAIGQIGLRSGAGAPIRFVPPRTAPKRLEDQYEIRVYETGEVETRAGSWHDLFNALVWLAFPQTKAALNRQHALGLRDAPRSSSRGAARDVLTLFDESGVILVCSNRELVALLRSFEWKALFWKRRCDVIESMHCVSFGHSLLEKALAPYPSITGRALIVEDYEASSHAQIDAYAARTLITPAMLASTRSLAPLPIMGIPGWSPESNYASFYDDTTIFRPGRGAL